MNKALWESDRKEAAAVERPAEAGGLDWRRKMSNHIAYGLLVYTGMQIFVTMDALKNTTGSILPYFALVVLVAAIIPGCRFVERRWETLSDNDAADLAFEPKFKRDRMLVWLAAIFLPLIITGLFKVGTFIV